MLANHFLSQALLEFSQDFRPMIHLIRSKSIRTLSNVATMKEQVMAGRMQEYLKERAEASAFSDQESRILLLLQATSGLPSEEKHKTAPRT